MLHMILALMLLFPQGNPIDYLERCYENTMNLDEWDITLVHLTEDTVDFVALAWANPSQEEAIIVFNDPYIFSSGGVSLHYTITHELSHILIRELGLLAEKANPIRARMLQEQLSSRIARIVIQSPRCR